MGEGRRLDQQTRSRVRKMLQQQVRPRQIAEALRIHQKTVYRIAKEGGTK